jgi:hypothetical protein
LEEAGVTWLRTVGVAPETTGRTVVVGWPGATPFRPADAPELYQWRLATNLWSVYGWAKTNNPARRQAVAALEIGNEPDLHFTPDLPDRMAATLKAAWWGSKSAYPDLPVLMPSLAAAPGPYARQLVANRVLNYTDGWNFHFYGWAQDFGASGVAQRRFADRHHGRHLPLWVTEYGFADLPAGPEPPAPILLARQRAFFETTTLAGAALGLDHQFAFCLQPVVDVGLDVGLSLPEGTPRPALTAWLEMVRRLRVATPAYRLHHLALGQTVGWVWQLPATAHQPETWWTLLQSPHRRTDFELPPLPDSPRTGRPTPAPLTSFFEFQLTFPPGTQPLAVGLAGEFGPWPEPTLHFNASAATNLHLLTPPRRFEVAGCRWERLRPPPARPPAPATSPSPVVVTLIPDLAADKTAVTYRYAPAQPVALAVRLYNFSATPQTGRWRLSLPPGWRLEPGQKPAGWVELPPLGEQGLTVTLHPPAQASGRPEVCRLRWWDPQGQTDQAELHLRPTGPVRGSEERLTAQWEPADSDTQWLRETRGEQQHFRLVEAASSAGGSLLLGLPPGAVESPDTVLRFRVRLEGAGGAWRRRIELITPTREVFRWGEDPRQTEPGETIEARVGDFTPAFWSHVGAGDPAAGRYVRVSLLGLVPGESVELSPVTVVTPGRR